MELLKEIEAIIVKRKRIEELNLIREIQEVISNITLSTSTGNNISIFEVWLENLREIETGQIVQGEATYELPFTWSNCGYIRVIWEIINSRARLTHCTLGVMEIEYEYCKIYNCDKLNYDLDKRIISFRPIKNRQ